MSTYTNHFIGEPDTLEYRCFFLKEGVPVSPFHDIPLWADEDAKIANFIVEIPRGTRAKLEVSRDEPLNPILQDTKKGKLRYVHTDYPFNYGAFPQTWEDPTFVTPETQAKGDCDPLDVCDVSSIQGITGQIKQVKILATYAMIDDGETDWKIIVIDVNDPLASKINTLEDLEEHMPGKAKETYEWLRDYKIPAGSGPNSFAFDGKPQDRSFALRVIHETNEQWKALIEGTKEPKGDGYEISLVNTTHAKFSVDAEAAKAHAKL